MFAKTKFVPMAMALAVGSICSLASAQAAGSIEEIAELNRQKVVADLRKHVDAPKIAAKAAADAEAASVLARKPAKEEKKDERAEPAPEVVSIYGVRPDALIAVVSSPGLRNMRVRAGESFANGWDVEKITPGGVTFRKEIKPTADAKQASSKKQKDDQPSVAVAPTYRRATVGLSQANRVATNSAGIQGGGALYPMPGLPMPGGGYQPAPLTMQLPSPNGGR